MTTLYNEQNIDRQKEFLECFKINTSSVLIEEIVILYEGDSTDPFLQNLLEEDKLTQKATIRYIQKRPFFSDFFAIANTMYREKKIIICNADIYFDSSLKKISADKLDNTLICLTRWNKKEKDQWYSNIANYNATRYKEVIWSSKLHPIGFSSSYDSWIFLAPIKEFYSDIFIGILGCEKIGYYAYLAGMTVMNPALNILSYHMHESNIRTYVLDSFLYPPPYLHLKVTTLSQGPFERIYLIK